MILKCKKISGLYDGPHSQNIITYYLYDENFKEYKWHEGPNKDLKCKIDDVLEGIVIKENGVIDYYNSFPKVIDLKKLMEL